MPPSRFEAGMPQRPSRRWSRLLPMNWEFQKILDHAGAVGNEPIGPLAHLGLGRAFALSGDSAKAKDAYKNFFASWTNSDADVPVLSQAKTEYAKLK
jgi:eukaryotic-like serine/threonine-protein kinase